MSYTTRNCDNCGKKYKADNRNLKRGWGLCCSKSCAAKKREMSRPDYNPFTVERNNRIRSGKMTKEDFENLPHSRKIYLNQKRFGRYAPNVIGGSGIITGITSEGYTIMDGVAYDEYDDPVYDVGIGEYDPGDSEYWDNKDFD